MCRVCLILLVGLLLAAKPAVQEPPATPVTTRDLVAALIESLRDTDSEVRQYAAVALANLGADAVEPLTVALRDKTREARAAAAYALGQIGGAARAATPQLMRALRDPEKEVRRQAAQALGRIVAADKVPANGYLVPPPPAPPPVFPPEVRRP
jgi:hypothetical protein